MGLSVSEHSEMCPQQFTGRDSLIARKLGEETSPPLLRDRLGNEAGDQTREVIRPMMVPLGARQHARVGWWGLVERTDVRNKEQSGTRSAAAQGTVAVHLGLEVCSADDFAGVGEGRG